MDVRKWFPAFFIAALATAAAHAGLEHDPHPAAALSVTPSEAAKVADAGPSGSPAVQAHDLRGPRAAGAFASFGISDGKVLAAVIGVDYHFNKQWHLGECGRITPYGELGLSYWEGVSGHTDVSSLHEAGVSFFARYRHLRTPLSRIRPFADLGVGLHYLTADRIEDKELGRHWQAGSNIGVGLLFGRGERFEIGVRVRHLSNAGTDEINWGVNQVLGRIALRF